MAVVGDARAPPSEARMAPITNVIVNTRRASMPTVIAVSRSSVTAVMTLPLRVWRRNQRSPTSTSSAIAGSRMIWYALYGMPITSTVPSSRTGSVAEYGCTPQTSRCTSSRIMNAANVTRSWRTSSLA